ncbi:MAG: BC1872 family protein [Moorellales bacterium]
MMERSNRQIDVEVAKKVFGKNVVFVKALSGYEFDAEADDWSKPVIRNYPCVEEHGVFASVDCGAGVRFNLVPFYSFELDAAMEVICHMVQEGWQFKLRKTDDDRYVARFASEDVVAEAAGDVIPVAICLAALKGVGG